MTHCKQSNYGTSNIFLTSIDIKLKTDFANHARHCLVQRILRFSVPSWSVLSQGNLSVVPWFGCVPQKLMSWKQSLQIYVLLSLKVSPLGVSWDRLSHEGRGIPVMAEDAVVTASSYQVMLCRVQHHFLHSSVEPTGR